MIRRDRPLSTRRGGIVLYYSDKLAVLRRSDLENKDLELIWVEVHNLYGSPFLLCMAYRPPNSL